ncbi:hypothetical protein, partial [Stutzerimonas kunmingensis]|uniref:hypothetical protein n=1 Tax=Stutzerimonas kunmingensis TaxID=1211807 RepID=UPI0028AD9B10
CHAGGRGFESRPLRHIRFTGPLNALKQRKNGHLGRFFLPEFFVGESCGCRFLLGSILLSDCYARPFFAISLRSLPWGAVASAGMRC